MSAARSPGMVAMAAVGEREGFGEEKGLLFLQWLRHFSATSACTLPSRGMRSATPCLRSLYCLSGRTGLGVLLNMHCCFSFGIGGARRRVRFGKGPSHTVAVFQVRRVGQSRPR